MQPAFFEGIYCVSNRIFGQILFNNGVALALQGKLFSRIRLLEKFHQNKQGSVTCFRDIIVRVYAFICLNNHTFVLSERLVFCDFYVVV